MVKQCLICTKYKQESEFGKEHIFPDALLRRIHNNILVIRDVCERCNNNLGLHVDAPLIKYFIIQTSKVAFDLKYADIRNGEIISFTYLGHIEGLEYDGKVCEHWCSPGGDLIYNFHKPYSEIADEEIVQGINPIHKRRGENVGDVVLLVNTVNPLWIKSLLASFQHHFKGHTKFVLPSKLIKTRKYPVPPKHLLDIISSKHEIKNTFKISQATGERFLAKIAIEMGAHSLNRGFLESDDLQILRNFLYEKDFRKRRILPVFVSGPVNIKRQLQFPHKDLRIEHVHVMAFTVIRERLFFYINFYGKVSAFIHVTSRRDHWEGKFTNGLVYFIAPALGEMFGPIRQCEDCLGNCLVDNIKEQIVNRMAQLEINPSPNI